MSDFQELIKSLDPLSGENVSSFNESEVKEFILSLKNTEKYTDELVKRNRKKIKFDKFLETKLNREEKKREAEDKRRKKNRLEETVEYTDQKSEEEIEDGLTNALTQLLTSGALTAALFAANPELTSKIKLKKLQGKINKFLRPKKPPRTPKPTTDVVKPLDTTKPTDVSKPTETSRLSKLKTTPTGATKPLEEDNIFRRIFGFGDSVKTLKPTSPRGTIPKVEVEIPGKGFRTVRPDGTVNNLLQQIRDKAFNSGFKPQEADRFAKAWKKQLVSAASKSRNALEVLMKGIGKSIPFIGAGLGYVSAKQRESAGFTRLAAFERTIASIDVGVGAAGVTGVGTGPAAVAAMGTFIADLGLLAIDVTDIVGELFTGRKYIASNTAEYWLRQFNTAKIRKNIPITPVGRNLAEQQWTEDRRGMTPPGSTLLERQRFGSGFRTGGRIRRFQTGGSTDNIALNTIKHHEALSSLTPGQNDYIKVGGNSVKSNIPWSRINDQTKIYSYTDSKGIPTIGWGTVTQPSGKQTKDGEVITKQKADQLLSWNYQNMKKYMSRIIPTWNGMSPSQQAAIMALTYNTGPGWFATSGPGAWPNLTRAVASGDFRGALKHWTGSDAVLEPRRKEERALFSSGPAKPQMKKEKQGRSQRIESTNVFSKVKSLFGFQTGGSTENVPDLGIMSSQGMILSMDNVPMNVITRGGASAVNEVKEFEKIASRYGLKLQSGGIVLFTGHGDILDVNGTNGLIGSINGETAEQYYTKKVAAAIRDKSGGKIKYIPSQVKWRAKSDPEPSNSNWNLGKKQASIGNIPIELHFDAPTGGPGLITSNLNRPVSEAEKGLMSAFGTISGNYGAGKYGVSMLELEAMKRSVAVSSLAEKFIKAVEGKYGTVSGDTTTPASTEQGETSSTQPSTGPSAGPSMMAGISNLIPGLGSFMQGFAEGFKQTSGIELGSVFGSASAPTGGENQEQETPSTSGANISGGGSDFWTLVAIASREDGDPQAWADVAQSLYNRAASGKYGSSSIRGLIIREGQYQPTWDYPRKRNDRKPNPEWLSITDAKSAAAATGQSEAAMKSVAAALTNSTLQKNAREFIQGRTDFTGYSKSNRRGQIQRKSGDNYFGWDFDYNQNAIASVPKFNVTTKQYGGLVDNSIQSRIVKQMVNGSYSSINNNEPQVVILNQPQMSSSPVSTPSVSIPKFSFEYITGDGTDGFVVNELYGLLQLSSL